MCSGKFRSLPARTPCWFFAREESRSHRKPDMNHPVGLHPKWVSSSETRCRPVRPRASQSSTSLSISFEEEMGVSVTVGWGGGGRLGSQCAGWYWGPGVGETPKQTHEEQHLNTLVDMCWVCPFLPGRVSQQLLQFLN